MHNVSLERSEFGGGDGRMSFTKCLLKEVSLGYYWGGGGERWEDVLYQVSLERSEFGVLLGGGGGGDGRMSFTKCLLMRLGYYSLAHA